MVNKMKKKQGKFEIILRIFLGIIFSMLVFGYFNLFTNTMSNVILFVMTVSSIIVGFSVAFIK